MPLWKAAFPWILLVTFAIIISIPVIQSGLYAFLGPIQKIPVVANKFVDLKLLNQAYFWVLDQHIIAAPLLVKTGEEAKKILSLWVKAGMGPDPRGDGLLCDRLCHGLVRPVGDQRGRGLRPGGECLQHERGDRALARPLLWRCIPAVQPDAGPLRRLRLRQRVVLERHVLRDPEEVHAMS